MAAAISLAVFIAVTAAIVLFGYHRYVLAGRVYENLETPAEFILPVSTAEGPKYSPFVRAAAFVGTKVPPSAETASELQRKLLAAGYRDRNGVAILYGLKLIVMASITLVIFSFEVSSNLSLLMRAFSIGVAILAGYRLPDYFLARRIRRRQKQLRRGLPDALDLIVVCAEAGLTIDRSFKNVSQQLRLVHPAICDEFSMFTAELSAGLRRKEALDNLAGRTQETEIRKFVAVLAQADRFGTSMADALRTHAEYLRSRRRQEAEEKASKVSVKLIFPIFFFIMPCMLLVTIGPAAITIMKQLSGIFTGNR
jgi:tight adherence protein C